MIFENWVADTFDQYEGKPCPECQGKLDATVYYWGVHVACNHCEYSVDLEPNLDEQEQNVRY
jgi:hypothetical protein